jgi:hypothetical protein
MDLSEMNLHQLDMRVIMDCLGEDFDELFLDEDCELSVEAAMTLAGLALRLLDGDLSLTELDRDYADWVELISGFIDGYDWSTSGDHLRARCPPRLLVGCLSSYRVLVLGRNS